MFIIFCHMVLLKKCFSFDKEIKFVELNDKKTIAKGNEKNVWSLLDRKNITV